MDENARSGEASLDPESGPRCLRAPIARLFARYLPDGP